MGAENDTTSHHRAGHADIVHRNVTLHRIAFGSCHSRGEYDKSRRRARASSVGATTANDGDPPPPSSSSSSLHSSSTVRTASSDTIWDVIHATTRPQIFLWTGDAVYSPREFKGDATVDVLRNEYRRMHDDEGMGYARFLRNMMMHDGENGGGPIARAHGTWDDHDYGGNDRGVEMPDKEARRDAYLEFLNVTRESGRYHRSGIYSSMDYRHLLDDDIDEDGGEGTVRVIFLDTRWHREGHCIPSLASNAFVPYGSLVSCATRWITACLDLPSIMSPYSRGTSSSSSSFWCPEGGGNLLGEDQWTWLEGQLKSSDASMHVVVSSIQVLTTNPVIESWGHFPRERTRLLNLLNDVPGLIILSGDVHHAEISSTKTTASMTTTDGVEIVEVTSSGLTHSCDGPFYGMLCSPILNAYAAHRSSGGNARDVDSPPYYTGRNFGSIDIDWSTRTFRVSVHDESGDLVLSTVRKMDVASNMSEEDVRNVSKCIDGHMWPYIRRVAAFHPAVIVVGCSCLLLYRSMSRRRLNTNTKKSKRD